MHGTDNAERGTVSVALIQPFVVRIPVAGELLGGISRRTVYRLISEGHLETVPIGETPMVPVTSIQAYLESQLTKARAARETKAAA